MTLQASMMNIFGQDPPPTVSSPCNSNDYQACKTSFRYHNKDKSVNNRTSPSSLSSGNYRNSCPSLGAPNSNLSNPRYTSPACQDRYNNQYGLPSKERPQPEQSRPRPHPFSNPRGNRNAISPSRPVSSNTQCSQGYTQAPPPTNGFRARSRSKSGEKVRSSSREKLSPSPILSAFQLPSPSPPACQPPSPTGSAIDYGQASRSSSQASRSSSQASRSSSQASRSSSQA